MKVAFSADNLLMAGIIVNSVLLALLALFVYLRFRRTARVFQLFQHDWDSAQSDHQHLVDEARARVGELAPVPAAGRRSTGAMNRAILKSELREHIVTLGKKGFAAPDIARACS